MKERTALKRASSRANGTKFGRPRKVDDDVAIATATRMRHDGHTAKDMAKFFRRQSGVAVSLPRRERVTRSVQPVPARRSPATLIPVNGGRTLTPFQRGEFSDEADNPELRERLVSKGRDAETGIRRCCQGSSQQRFCGVWLLNDMRCVRAGRRRFAWGR